MTPRILVATDGTPGALGALRTARRLAERDGARVEVVAACDPPARFYGLEAVGIMAGTPPPFTPVAVEALRVRVQAQLAQVGGGASAWPLVVKLGRAAQTIARAAADHGATLVLLGLRRHAAVERWHGGETLLRVIQLSHVRALAVPEDAATLPRRAVVAIDFSDLSLRAADAAVELVGPGGRIDLVHVTGAPLAESRTMTEWIEIYRHRLEERIGELAGRLGRSVPLVVHGRILESGDPGLAILRWAEEVGAELVAVGSHGHGLLGRIVMGSVSSRVAHGARCSPLIAPQPEEPDLGLTESELLADLGRAGDLAHG